MKNYTEIQVQKKLLQILNKYPGEPPTVEHIVKECKGDNVLAGKVHLMLVNEILELHLHETESK